MNHIIDELINDKIEVFTNEYLKLSRSIFEKQDGISYHNGEFGMYRERIVAELLGPLLPKRLSIGTGFIVTKNNNISTQCDLIIYDNTTTPVFENYDQRFFPVESVVGVVEVKSKMSKSQVSDALIKLTEIKKLKDESQNKLYIYKDKGDNVEFNTKTNTRDQIATFLVCEEFDFDINDLDVFFKNIYHGIDKSLYHNMILCINGGCYLYKDYNNVNIYSCYFKYDEEEFNNCLILPNLVNNKYHIKFFMYYFYQLISSISVMYIELSNYISI